MPVSDLRLFTLQSHASFCAAAPIDSNGLRHPVNAEEMRLTASMIPSRRATVT